MVVSRDSVWSFVCRIYIDPCYPQLSVEIELLAVSGVSSLHKNSRSTLMRFSRLARNQNMSSRGKISQR